MAPKSSSPESAATELDPEILREMEDLGMRVSVAPGSSLSSSSIHGYVGSLKSDERVVYHLLVDRRSRRSSFTNLLPLQHRSAAQPAILADSDETVLWLLFSVDSFGSIVLGFRSVFGSELLFGNSQRSSAAFFGRGHESLDSRHRRKKCDPR